MREADLANITAYLISETNGTASSLPEPPACDWDPTVKLWAALNAQPARPVAVGQKRMATIEGRTFPVWDFNDVDVSAARDPANKLTFFATVDGVRTLHNVWTHAADARTVFPQADVPTGTISRSPLALDGRIEIVWPHDNLPPEQATLANITAYLFALDTLQAIGPDASWPPTVRLHWSLNTEAEKLPGTGIVGVPRTITASNGVKFQAWDFNDVDISAANETLNKLYFWVSADDVVTFPNVWAHGVDAADGLPAAGRPERLPLACFLVHRGNGKAGSPRRLKVRSTSRTPPAGLVMLFCAASTASPRVLFPSVPDEEPSAAANPWANTR